MADADIDMPEASSSTTTLKDKKRFEVKKVGLVFYTINKITLVLEVSPNVFQNDFLCLVIANNAVLYFHLFSYFQYYHHHYFYYYHYYY